MNLLLATSWVCSQNPLDLRADTPMICLGGCGLSSCIPDNDVDRETDVVLGWGKSFVILVLVDIVSCLGACER